MGIWGATQQAGRAVARWLMWIGLVRAILVITVFSVTSSVLVTGLSMHLALPAVVYSDWVPFAIITPAIISPIVALVVMSLAYRLDEAHRALERLALTDPLTGAGNRRRFFDLAERELERAVREQGAVSLLLLDLDHFKALNDRHGHAAGDAALIEVADLCAATLRTTDVFCRWGGEEFCALLPGVPMDQALALADRLRGDIERLDPPGKPGHVSVSIGVASGVGVGLSLEELLLEADRQLYVAKAEGRNRVAPAPCGDPETATTNARSA